MFPFTVGLPCSPPGGEQHDTIVRSVAALLTYKLKNGETPPDTGYHQPESCGACSFCHGDGAVVLDVLESDRIMRTLIVHPERRFRVRITV